MTKPTRISNNICFAPRRSAREFFTRSERSSAIRPGVVLDAAIELTKGDLFARARRADEARVDVTEREA